MKLGDLMVILVVLVVIALHGCKAKAIQISSTVEQTGRIKIETIDVRVIEGKPQKVAVLRAWDVKRTYPEALYWSPDDRYILIQGVRLGTIPQIPLYDKPIAGAFLIDIDSGSLESLGSVPLWAQQYWDFKSSMVSPGRSMTIERSVNEFKLGSNIIGKSWSDGDRRDARHGEAIRSERESFGGESEFSAPVGFFHRAYDGLTWSWAPPDGEAIVYFHDYKIYIKDSFGYVKELARGNLFLPAWSNDGTRIAFIEVPVYTGDWFLYIADLQSTTNGQ